MKKKLIALLLAGTLCLSLAACGSDNESSQSGDATKENAQKEETKEPEDDGVINFDGDGYNITYVKHEKGTDYKGNPCLFFYYTFTNNGEENANAGTSATIKCFQNNVQCETAITLESNDSADNYLLDVQPGGSVEVCQTFSLSDDSDVTVEVSDWISLDDKTDKQILKLQ